MTTRARILVVAATERELALPADGSALGWHTLACGVGPVEAAARTAAALSGPFGGGADARPAALLHIGIAGARRASGLGPAAVVVGSEALFTDLDIPERFGTNRSHPDARLLAAARACLPDARCAPIATTSRVGGSSRCEVEAMEGFAVLRAAELAGLPAIEVRVISNEIEEQDRTRWHFEHAFATVHAITPRLVEAISQCVN